MKWVFFVLLGVNLALLGFHWFQQREVAKPAEYKEYGVQSIQLLNERESVERKVSDGERCLLIGPHENGEESKLLVEQLNKFELNAELIRQQLELAPSYWVTLEVSDGERVDDVMSSLKTAGFDNYLISGGELAGRLSLGVFDNIDLARRMKKKLVKQGYSVKTSEKKKTNTEFWVSLPVSKSLIYKEKIAEVASGLDDTKKMREIFCKSVASENKFP